MLQSASGVAQGSHVGVYHLRSDFGARMFAVCFCLPSTVIVRCRCAGHVCRGLLTMFPSKVRIIRCEGSYDYRFAGLEWFCGSIVYCLTWHMAIGHASNAP